MLSGARPAIAPAYLLACLLIGGSAQGIWGNMVLQVAGIIIIAWAALERTDNRLAPAARQLLLLAILAIGIVGLQMLPLPSRIWSHLGPRQVVAEGWHALGRPVPAEPLSLTPAESLNALLGIIPSLALVCAMVRLKAYQTRWLIAALLAGTIAGVGLGAVQVAGSAVAQSPWYLYEDTNRGRAVGFFANADHMASLLLLTIPFVAAIVVAARNVTAQRYFAIVAIAGGVAILVLVGLALNGSLAGYGLAVPVIAASALIILPSRGRMGFWIVTLAALLMAGAIIAIETTAIGSASIGEHATSAVQSRADLVSTTSRAAADFMPFGSGLGSFRHVYALYENPEQITRVYVIHAHNDYLEVALELGVAGIILMLLFLMWWAAAVRRAWQTPEPGPFARAAAIASAAVLVHSLVDFPLRTAAISACFGMCLGLLADSRAAPPKEAAELRRARHVVI